jgi:AcrR family transcriptional regulator
MATETTPPRRGRPRSAASEQAILHAALDLMAEGQGPATLSIAAIARRAGAGKDTIYRRWPNKEDLLLEALAQAGGPVGVPPGVGLRDGLVMILAEMIGRLQRERDRRILRSMQSADAGFPRLRERYHEQVVKRRVDAIKQHVDAAVARGELERDGFTRDMIEMPFHHVLTRALEDDPVQGDPTEAAGRLVDVVLRGIGAA